MIRRALLVLSGNAAASLLLLIRNLIVARMIPVADYGVAATFAVAMAVVEMASALGLQQQIVQSKDGDDPRFQAVLQGFQVLRGVMAGVALFFLAYPLANFLGIPDIAWAYQVLALVPVLNALQHFDIHRMNRQMRFGPLILTGAVPAAVALGMVWPLVEWFGDWRVMLWSILAQALVGVFASHILAERPYRLGWDKNIVAGSLRFGWPLLVNAGLLFLVFQGDKLIVGRAIGMEALAIFAMGITLTLTPTMIVAKSAQRLFLPKLTQSAGRAQEFERIARITFLVHILSGGLLVSTTLLLGPILVSFLLGSKYDDLTPILTLMAIVQGIHIFKGGPSNVALSRAQTGNSMISNIARVALLPVAWIAVQQNQSIVVVLFYALAGESIGAIVAFSLVRIRLKIKIGPLSAPTLFTLLAMTVAGTQGLDMISSSGQRINPVWLICLSVVFQSIATVLAFIIWKNANKSMRQL